MEQNNESETKARKKVDYILLKREVRAISRGQAVISKDLKKIKSWMIRQKRSQSFGWSILKVASMAVANVTAIVFFFGLMLKSGVPLGEALKQIIGMIT